ncbi:hypothetical protein [Actinacidiphila glaucinigra]|uniref:hypothetical protein n=1 Tax=Actinacidiphila glaucinigra TaxID=235986 RepID=UPI003D8F43F5
MHRLTSQDLATALLPDLPAGGDWPLEGFDWIERLPERGWRSVNVWGTEGWDLGNWPYQVAAHYDCEALSVYGLATNTEGDTTVNAYTSREERDAATNELAVSWWIDNENGPDELTPDMSPIPLAYCGPFREL